MQKEVGVGVGTESGKFHTKQRTGLHQGQDSLSSRRAEVRGSECEGGEVGGSFPSISSCLGFILLVLLQHPTHNE